MDNFTVYRHTTPSGKVYIGITRQNPIRRWRPDGSGYKENNHFWNAICSYGWDNITHEIIASGLTKDEACEMEIALIAEHDSMNPNKGYNGTIGGEHPPFRSRKKHAEKFLKLQRREICQEQEIPTMAIINLPEKIILTTGSDSPQR